jgi:hypothetical protein
MAYLIFCVLCVLLRLFNVYFRASQLANEGFTERAQNSNLSPFIHSARLMLAQGKPFTSRLAIPVFGGSLKG